MVTPELTDGAGFTFETAVVPCCQALAGGTMAPPLNARRVQLVAQQNTEARRESLDDVNVDAKKPVDDTPMLMD